MATSPSRNPFSFMLVTLGSTVVLFVIVGLIVGLVRDDLVGTFASPWFYGGYVAAVVIITIWMVVNDKSDVETRRE